MAKNKAPKFDPQWARAKNACRLNMAEICMAKALGMSPKALIKNNPSPTQRWKLPVKHWIRELHEERFGRKAGSASKSTQPRDNCSGQLRIGTLSTLINADHSSVIFYR